MIARLFVFAALILAAPFAAAAQTLSADYRALLEDAALYEDGAHFDAAARLVARNADGGAEAVATALADDPALAARARAALGLPQAAPAQVQAAPAPAPAQTAPAAAPAAPAAPAEEGGEGVIGRLASALVTPPSEDALWSGALRAGLRWDSGNSDQQDYTLGLEVQRALAGWGLQFGVDYAYSKSGGAVARDQLSVELLGERELGERWTAFAQTDFERDALSSYEYTGFLGAGVGYRVLERPGLLWTLRAAPGVRYRKPETGGSSTGAALELGSDFDWELTDRISFGSKSSLTLADASRAEQIFTLASEVGGGWGAEARYRYRYEFDALPGFDSGDSRLDINLVKEF